MIPNNLLNKFLLTFSSLYKTKFINFESSLDKDGIDDLLEGIDLVKNLPGDIIECGCARCGTTIILAKYLSSIKITKKIYALDSFSGFNPQELDSEKQRGFTDVDSQAFTYSSYKYVKQKIQKLNLSDSIIPVKGYFQQTLEKIDSNYSMALIDCDLSDSLTYAAEIIWPKLADNGLLFFDDYDLEGFLGVKPAVDKFVEKHKNEIKCFGVSRRLYCVQKMIK